MKPKDTRDWMLIEAPTHDYPWLIVPSVEGWHIFAGMDGMADAFRLRYEKNNCDYHERYVDFIVWDEGNDKWYHKPMGAIELIEMKPNDEMIDLAPHIVHVTNAFDEKGVTLDYDAPDAFLYRVAEDAYHRIGLRVPNYFHDAISETSGRFDSLEFGDVDEIEVTLDFEDLGEMVEGVNVHPLHVAVHGAQETELHIPLGENIAYHVLSHLHRWMLAWGKPKRIVTDNPDLANLLAPLCDDLKIEFVRKNLD